MVCSTIRVGFDCIFMTKKGCQFNGGTCNTIVEQCDGCQRIVEYPTGKYCAKFLDPSAKWKNGACSMATHIKTEIKQETKKINPLKASKRSH
jgi:hypothetical protein